MRAHHVFLVAVALSLPFVPAPAAEVSSTRVAERTVKALSSIQWAGDLDQVLEKAKTEKKLVFWLQIVGDLAGGLWSAGHSLRAVTLSDDAVIDKLNRSFASGWKNIKGATPYAGTSNTHMPTNAALEVSNCAGHHNVQMVFMTSEGRVLHVLPGFWNPRHLLHEMDLAVELGKLAYRKDISAAERNAKYLDLHLHHALDHSAELRGKSYHQGFDKKNLEKREESDFHRKEGFISYGLKTPDQVIHERLAERPFAPWASFDVRRTIDMGQKQYSYNHGLAGMTWPKTGKPMGPMGNTKGEESKAGDRVTSPKK